MSRMAMGASYADSESDMGHDAEQRPVGQGDRRQRRRGLPRKGTRRDWVSSTWWRNCASSALPCVETGEHHRTCG